MERTEWLLNEQAKCCDMLDQLQAEYNATNLLMEAVHKRIAELQKEDEILNSQMDSIRHQINLKERKVCQINKALRNKNDPSIYDPRDFNGDRSNI